MMQEFTPIEYLMIDVANNFGHDKEDWQTRIDWFKANEENLPDMVKEADEPALFQAGLWAYQAAKRGEAIGYGISLDATASGAQILALLIGCEKTALLCNVMDTGHREDLYTNFYELMKQKADIPHITRKQAKDAAMPAFYGSEKLPRELLGDGTPAHMAFYDTMEEDLPGVWALNEALLALWDHTAYKNSWVLPDNFHVECPVLTTLEHKAHFMDEDVLLEQKVNAPKDYAKELAAHVTHSVDGYVVREVERRCDYNPDQIQAVMQMLLSGDYSSSVRCDRAKDKKLQALSAQHEKTGILSARVFEFIDAENIAQFAPDDLANLIKTLPERPFHVLPVHDCFRVHPNYGNDLRRQYNRVLSEIGASNLLAAIVTDISGYERTVKKMSDKLADAVLNANYALS